MELKYYLQDGAAIQAKCVLAHLQGMDVESSWNSERHKYEAETKVARWENGREQGYVVMLHNKKWEQLNIAFFEHRNSDNICAIMWQENTMNSPTIESANFGEKVYKDKWDVSHTVSYYKYQEMADWINNQLTAHWEAGLKK